MINFKQMTELRDRVDNSDEFDDLEYCINDLFPETRRNPELTQQIANQYYQSRAVISAT